MISDGETQDGTEDMEVIHERLKPKKRPGRTVPIMIF